MKADAGPLLERLETINRSEPSRENVYALAELAYIGGRKTASTDRDSALELYGSAVMYAHDYLFDDSYVGLSNPYDPQFRGACDLYNAALEELLRTIRDRGSLRPGTSVVVNTAHGPCQLDIKLASTGWLDEDVDQIEFVSDYQIHGLTNHYRSFGLGVPLVAIREHREQQEISERFYPPRLAFPLTAFLTIDSHLGSRGRGSANRPGSGGNVHAVLELHDPLSSTSLAVANRRVPLEADLSTPLAYFLNQPEFSDTKIANLGLLSPERAEKLTGLYMLEPYRAEKMPVVMVHGLWSSPVTWMEMFNDLRSDPRIRDHYQFWFYLYPTGEPFWLSAERFRSDLAELRSVLDPQREVYALDQMVLVGHSMGGLVSKLQTVESGNNFWQTVSERPFSELHADEELRRTLQATYFFSPNSSVQRVVTIGTPHRGSYFSNGLTRWLSDLVIDVPGMLLRGRQRLIADNPQYFRPRSAIEIDTSIESLAPDSPLLDPLRTAQPRPGVVYHNIIGEKHSGILGSLTTRFDAPGDGVVTRESAHVDNAASEITVPADHVSVHRHPQSILEVRRILLEQIVAVAEARQRAPLFDMADQGQVVPAGATSSPVPAALTLPVPLPSPTVRDATGYRSD